MEGVPNAQLPARTRVFVSYSRKDTDAVDVLLPALQAQGYDVVVDRKDIAAAEVWRRRLEDLILDSDAVVFVISPHSIHSEVCGWEVERTIAYGKKLVPIVWQSIDAHACPPEIADRNWVAWQHAPGDATPGTQTIEALRVAIERDIAWERERTVWIGRAIRWDRALRAPGRLLRGEEVVAAEAWAAGRPTSAAALPDVLLAYLSQSRERERKDRDHLRSITGRAFVTPIINAIRDREPDRALRLLATAMVLAQDPDFSLVPQLWIEGARCLMQQPIAAAGDRSAPQFDDPDGVRAVFGVSADCRFAVCQEVGGAVRFTDLTSGNDAWSTTLDFRVRKFEIVDGATVIAVGKLGDIARLNAESGAVQARANLGGRTDTIRFIDEERALLVAIDRSVVRYALDGNKVERLREFGGEVADIAYCAAMRWGLAIVIPPEGAWVAETFGVEEGEQYRLDDDVRFVCISKDGSRVCLAERLDAEVFVVGQSGPPVRVRHSGKAPAMGEDLRLVALSDDGGLLLTGSNDGTARVWDTTNGAELHRFDHVDEALIVEAAFGQDMQTVLTVGTDCTARLWCLRTGEELMRISNRLSPRTTGWDVLGFESAGLSRDGQLLWSQLPGGLLQVWPVRRLKEHPLSTTVTTHTQRFSNVQFLDDGRIAVQRGAGPLQVFDAAGERIITERRFAETVLSARVLDKFVVARGHSNRLFATGLADGDPSWVLRLRARVETVAYLPLTDTFAVGGGDYGKDGFVELISRDGKIVARSEMPGWVSALSYHAERRLLLIGDVQGQFMAWSDDERREPVWMAPFSGKVDSIAVPPGGRHFYVVADHFLWRVEADDRRKRIVRFTSSVRSMACDPSDRLLFIDTLIGPQVVDIRRGALLFELANRPSFEDERAFQKCVVAPDWRRILIVTRGGRLLTYDIDGLLALGEAPREAIATKLARGNDLPRHSERVDLLMSDRPADLLALLQQINV